MDKVSIFVDVQNVYYTARQQHNCHFDYNNFWMEVTSGRELAKAIAYATDKGDNKQVNFQHILRKIGFEVKLKPFIQRSDGSTKGDWDVGIAMEMVEQAKLVDLIVLASGDGDFTSVVDKITGEFSIPVEIYGVRELTAASLMQSATRFIPIEGNLLLPIPKTW
ncbi:MAG: NYN domain-containing protein [Thermodesulfobacteriota bacterium]